MAAKSGIVGAIYKLAVLGDTGFPKSGFVMIASPKLVSSPYWAMAIAIKCTCHHYSIHAIIQRIQWHLRTGGSIAACKCIKSAAQT